MSLRYGLVKWLPRIGYIAYPIAVFFAAIHVAGWETSRTHTLATRTLPANHQLEPGDLSPVDSGKLIGNFLQEEVPEGKPIEEPGIRRQSVWTGGFGGYRGLLSEHCGLDCPARGAGKAFRGSRVVRVAHATAEHAGNERTKVHAAGTDGYRPCCARQSVSCVPAMRRAADLPQTVRRRPGASAAAGPLGRALARPVP